MGQTVWAILLKSSLPQAVTVADVQEYAGALEIGYKLPNGKLRWVEARCWNRQRDALLAQMSGPPTASMAPASPTSSSSSPVQGDGAAEVASPLLLAEEDDDDLFGSNNEDDEDGSVPEDDDDDVISMRNAEEEDPGASAICSASAISTASACSGLSFLPFPALELRGDDGAAGRKYGRLRAERARFFEEEQEAAELASDASAEASTAKRRRGNAAATIASAATSRASRSKTAGGNGGGGGSSKATASASGKLPARSHPAVLQECTVPQCRQCAVAEHPIVRGMQVCALHHRALRTLVQRSEPGVCAVNLAERQRCNVILDDAGKESIFCCNGLGCRVGFRRPCCVCGTAEQPGVGGGDESHQGSSDSTGGGQARGDDDVGSDDDDIASHSSSAAEMPTPCPHAGCTAWAHESCRQLLARRVCVWWDEDRAWYWGTADVPPAEMQTDEVEVLYDDNTREAEDLSGGADSPPFEWLVAPGGGIACICRKSSRPEHSAAKENSEQEDAMRACAICCTQAVLDGAEPGAVNDSAPAQGSNPGWLVLSMPEQLTICHSNPASQLAVIFCDGCGVPVHVFCYGQVHAPADMLGRPGQKASNIPFKCDQCLVDPEVVVCKLCPRRTGLMRRLRSGGWAHPSCITYNPAINFGKQARSHNWTSLCPQNSSCGLCFKDEYTVDVSRDKRLALEPFCSVPDCPGPTSRYLLHCGGRGAMCRRNVHVSCAQQPGSGWHLKLHETDDGSQVEVLCSQCDDVYLDCSGAKPRYKLLTPSSQPAVAGVSTPYASDAECEGAPFLFQDWCHGFNGGMRRACERLGGVCTGACDSDLAAREAYLATFPNQSSSLSNLSEMGEDFRVARASDIILCGFCCKPFSPAGLMHGFADDRFGDNFDLMVKSLEQRRERGITDPCLLCENVPNLLSFILPAQLAFKNLGYHCKVYVVSGAHFRCANRRERVVYVCLPLCCGLTPLQC